MNLTITMMSLISSAAAATFTVDTTADSADASPGDGICSDSGGSCSLRAAIHEANSLSGSDSIALPAGTYTLSLIADGVMDTWLDTLLIEDDLSIVGAGSDMDVSTSTIVGNGSASVFTIYGASAVDLQALTVASGGGFSGLGAGIRNYDAAMVLSDITVRNSWADDLGSYYWVQGGGIYNGSAGTMSLIDSEVVDNKSTQGNYWSGGLAEGGGIYNEGVLDIETTLIAGNSSTGYSGLAGYGGGIYNAGTLSCDRCTIADNGANLGGGIYSTGSLTLSRSTIIANDAVLDSGYAMFYGTGGGLQTSGTVTMDRTAVVFNAADDTGGGWYITSGSTSSENSTFSKNSADYGGGISASGGALDMNNVTVAQNTAVADIDTGGLDIGGASVSATNVLLGGQIPAGAADCSGTVSSGGNNLVSLTDTGAGTVCAGFTQPSDITGTSSAPISAGLGPLTSFGFTWVHTLMQVSEAIDAGDNSSCASVDQRGLYRPFDADGDSIAVCDIGAFERHSLPTY